MKSIFLTIILVAIFGCDKNEKASDSTSREKEIADFVVIKEKLVLDESLVASGKELFGKYCASCHSEGGHGIAGQGPRLNSPDFLGLANDHFISETIKEGRPGTAMIAFKDNRKVKKKIPDLVAYIRSWQNDYSIFKQYKVDWEMKITGDPLRGRKSFRQYCASCHGPNGGGYADGGPGTAIGLSGFLKVAKDDYIKKTILIGRAGTAMKAFGHSRGLAALPESEIDDVVAYLRSLE